MLKDAERDRGKDDLFSVGVMGRIVVRGRRKTFDPDAIATYQRLLSTQLTKARKINVVFVVDGTTSLSPYFGSIAAGIRKSMRRLKALHKQNSFRFGAVVYRDLAERDRLVEKQVLSPDASQTTSFLDNVVARDYYDNDPADALNYGLQEALRATGFSEEETNVIVLVGDAGNHHRQDKGQVAADDIVDALVALNCYFLVFQVTHGNHPTFREFLSQTESIIKKTADEVYRRLEKEYASAEIPPPSWRRSGSTLKLENGGYGGWIFGLREGDTLDPAKLEREVSDFVQHLEKRTNRLVGIIKRIIDGYGLEEPALFAHGEDADSEEDKFSSPLGPAVYEFLRLSGIKAEDLESLAAQKFQIYTTGYAPRIIFQQRHPLFKYVLLMSHAELGRLVLQMEDLLYAATSDQAHEELFNTWKSLLISYEGEVSPRELKRLTFEELHERLWELPGKKSFFTKVTLGDILGDPESYNEIREYKDFIREAYRKLKMIYDSQRTIYEYSFLCDEILFYWIPEDLLP